MASFRSVLLLPLWSVLCATIPKCHVPGAGRATSCGPALLQTRYTSSKVELVAARAGPAAVQSGDTVLFRVARTGRRLTVEPDGKVHAFWDHDGQWQSFVIEKEVGSGNIQSGDVVFLTAWTGKTVTVGDTISDDFDRTALHAKWSDRSTWQKLTIEKKGEAGLILSGDEIFLQAWTGARVDADAPVSEGAVRARWEDQGEWQKLIVEAAAPATTTAPTPAPAATEPPAPTTPEPAATAAPQAAEVVSSNAWETFQLLNKLRAEGFTCPNGAAFKPNSRALKFDCRLWRAAKLHSEDMASRQYFDHDSLDGRSPWERAEEQGIEAHSENIGAGSSTAAGVLEQWKTSDKHCMNMMNLDFKVVGVGYAAGGHYGHFWTQMLSLYDVLDLDKTCYPSGAALMQGDAGSAAEDHQKTSAEA